MLPDTTLELTGPQFPSLRKAFQATLTLSQFDRLLNDRLGINREDIALGDDYTEITQKVISEANRSGWVYRLVNAGRQEKPANAVFVYYASLLKIAPDGLPADEGQLESIIRKSNRSFDVEVFRSRIGQIEGRVCRVDINGEGEGTGFLVGKRAVLTNYHVVETAIKGTNPLDAFTCRFDYKVRADGASVNKGTAVAVTEILAHSPYDAADLKRTGGLPNPANLDYALLRLASDIGDAPIGGPNGDERGAISLPTGPHTYPVGSPLFIVQHPNKRPMKLALDTNAILSVNGNNTRVEYATNTEGGSSGSPCFNQDWELVVLHHAGDPDWVPTWNEGVPIALIRQQLVEKGLQSHLA